MSKRDEIRTDCRLIQISDGEHFSVNAYYDVCPESSDGTRVVYFRFDGELPGPGEVVVAGVDGSDARVVGRTRTGNPHAGVFQQWIDDRTVAFNDIRDGRLVTVVASLSGDEQHVIPSGVRMVHEGRRMGLLPVRWGRIFLKLGDRSRPDGVDRIDFETGEVRRILSVEQVIDAHPRREELTAEAIAAASLGHTKWAADGTRFMMVLKNEGARRTRPELPRIKSIFVADADGGDVRYVAEFGHHPDFAADGGAVYASGTSAQPRPGMTVYPLDGGEPVLLDVGPCGHPTLSADRSEILTDLDGDPEEGFASVLLYDVATGERRTLASFPHQASRHGLTGPTLPPKAKSDPHPVWSRDGRRVYFNAKGTNGIATLFALQVE